MARKTKFVPHRWMGAFVAALTHVEAAEYQTWVDGQKRGEPPKVQRPNRVMDVYCYACRKSYADVGGKSCEPIQLVVSKGTHQLAF